jgi:DNA (cytosine-5)-methyltransferase 1
MPSHAARAAAPAHAHAILEALAPTLSAGGTSQVIQLRHDQAPTGSPVRRRTVTFADQFCGAGGWTQGAVEAIEERGLEIADAAAFNHWPTAVDTHQTNHPRIRHFCQDLATVRPIVAFPGGKIDVLIASPSCVYHSGARGGRPIHDQQRMDPWYIVPWLTDLDVTVLVVENVPEFVHWGPVDPATGRPIKKLRGKYYLTWVNAICGLGYTYDARVLRCADYGDGTTRERYFGIFRRDGRPIRWPMPTHGPEVGDGLFAVRKWRSARDIIDWTRRGQCIFERKRPLASNTIRRLIVGARRYFGLLAPLYVAALEVELQRSMAYEAARGRRSKPVVLPQRDQQVIAEGAALIELHGTGTAHSIGEPLPAIAAGGKHYGVAQADLAFVVGQQSGAVARPVTQPLPTVATAGAIRVAAPQLVSVEGLDPLLFHVNHSGPARLQSVDQPLPSQPGSRGLGMLNPLIVSYYRTGTATPVAMPLPTISTRERLALADPSVVQFHEIDLAPEAANDNLASLVAAKRLILIIDPVTGAHSYAKLTLLFRMLLNHELAAATSFPAGYRFAGNDKEVTKQIGNAVPVATARAIIGAVLDSMELPLKAEAA